MSAPGAIPPTPEPPGWFQGTNRSAAPAAPPAAKFPATPPNWFSGPKIKVDPADAQPVELTGWQTFCKWLREGLPGLSISLALHAGLLILFALLVYQLRQIDPDLWIDVGWRSESQAANNSRARGPVDLSRFEREDPNNQRMILQLPNDEPQGNRGQEDATPSLGVAPVEVKNLLENRNLELRNQMLAEHGGDEQTEAAIRNALLWLKRQQREGGQWLLHEGYPQAGESTLRTDTGATALALLAFLGAGHTHRDGDHREAVQKGLQWLIRIQKPNGNFHDRYEEGHQTTFYAHSQAVIVMCEAYALTGDDELRVPTENGIRFLVESQNRVEGGWKYRPADDLTVGDLSVTGWALMALHTARAAGFEVPPEVFLRASLFLQSVQEQQGTRFKYMPSDPANRVSTAMTAEGLLCLQFLGEPRDQLGMRGGVAFLLGEINRPEWKAGRRNVYEWYYTAQVLHNLGGQEWRDWYQQVKAAIVKTQERNGSIKPGQDTRGSWHPLEPRGHDHEYASQCGRLYLTAMCVLILETPYRHKPIYSPPPQQAGL